jgi:2-polyprenyl-3-methyl-5-hydroxy-6-metoxy-1,4-benzoquinol methylase
MYIKNIYQYNIIVRTKHQEVIDRFFETYLPTIEGFDVKTWVVHPEGITVPEGVVSIVTNRLGNETYIPILEEIAITLGKEMWKSPKVYFGIFNDDLVFSRDWLKDVSEALKTYDSVTPGYINTSNMEEFNLAVDSTRDETGIIEFFMGACQLTKIDIFLRIGMLDPQFDWSCDDLDLLWRLKLNGLKSVTLKKITIAHAHGTTRNKEMGRWYIEAEKGKKRFCDKHGAIAFKEIRGIYKGHDYFVKKQYKLNINTSSYWDKIWTKYRNDDKPKIIQAHYDRANTPDYWDDIWKAKSRRYEKYSMQVAWDKIRKSGAKSVLDVGCGNGRLLYGVRDLECFGIDISDVGIKRMLREYGIEGLAMSAYDLDKLNRKFDFVVMNHTLEHIQGDEEVIRKCKEVLNPGGTLFIAVPNGISGPEETEEHIRSYNQSSLKELILRVFNNCEISYLHNHLFSESKNI